MTNRISTDSRYFIYQRRRRSNEVARRLLCALTEQFYLDLTFNLPKMNTDNHPTDEEDESSESSILKQEERTDKTLLGEFGLAALAGLSAFFSAVLTTVVEGHSVWRPFWLTICIICLVCAIALIVQGARNFGRRP